MKLADYQAAVLAAVTGRRALDEVGEELGASAGRLGIYRDFVAGHVRSILVKLYPTVKALVGSRWPELVEHYRATHPPRWRDLNLAGAAFPAFLDGRGLGFEAALAQLEWEIFAAAVHAATLDGSGAGPRVNPTLSLFETWYPVVPFLALHSDPRTIDGSAARPARLAVPEVAAVCRRPERDIVAFHLLDAASARALETLARGEVPDDRDLFQAREIGVVI